ncbi:MAG: GntR family transcriptional regulator [Bermanella sp.]|jgi:predicted RNA-binding protein (virulence factor B family)
MLEIGRFNDLTILRQLPRGLQLDGGEHGEILLPKQYTTEEMKIGDSVKVFIYRDSEDRLIATTQTPLAMVGDFAYLNVVDESPVGAFLDMGLQRDILVPFSEQNNRLEKGRKVLVRIYLDDSDRLTASTKLDTFLYDTDETNAYKTGEEVKIVVGPKTDLGIKVIVDGTYWGLIYHSDVFQPLNRGDQLTGYVKRVREDQKIEIVLQKPGFARVEGLAGDVLEQLTQEGGFIALSDKSAPDDIKKKFHCSKNSYKQAIGTLYKQRLIRIEKDGIYLEAK